jgi:hypothetical protein
MQDDINNISKKYGVYIITPQDKINSYIEGLKLIRGNPTGEAGQLDAIGDQYKRLNQFGLAKAAYQSAISSLRKIDISQEKFSSEKEKMQFEKEIVQWEQELLAKLKTVVEDFK